MNEFDNLAEAYQSYRRPVPDEVLNYIWSLFRGVKHPYIVDVGCGTGIHSRKLAQRGAVVIGCDPSENMLEVAARINIGTTIFYRREAVEELSLEDEQFDGVTAFSAFHWVKDKQQGLAQIRRILKPGGYVLIVNKDNVGKTFGDYRKVLGQFIAQPFPNAKQDYEPAACLAAAGFSSVHKRKFQSVEHLSLDYFTTVSAWNLVLKEKQQEALKALEEFFKDKLVKGFIERPISVSVVTGRK